MATYFRDKGGLQIEQGVSTVIYFEVGTAEAQTITVSKAGGAFGATAGTTYSALDGTLATLTIHTGDVDTNGQLAFKCVGATDTQYIYSLQVVDHDPTTDIAAILTDTGTDGVAIADGYLAAAKFAADFLTEAKIADNALDSEHITTALADKIADEVLKELLADHKGTAGSLAEAINFILQRAGWGKLITDESDGDIEVYDTDGSTVLKTMTKSVVGDETTWTPS